MFYLVPASKANKPPAGARISKGPQGPEILVLEKLRPTLNFNFRHFFPSPPYYGHCTEICPFFNCDASSYSPVLLLVRSVGGWVPEDIGNKTISAKVRIEVEAKLDNTSPIAGLPLTQLSVAWLALLCFSSSLPDQTEL